MRRDYGQMSKGSPLKQVATYLIVGFATLATYTVVAYLLSRTTSFFPGLVSTLAYGFAAATNFVGHKLFTFKTNRSLGSTFPRYVLLLVFNALVGGLFVQMGVAYWNLTVLVANALMLCGVTVSTFFIMKWWVMADVRAS